jgi:hypothetical protein
MNAEIKDGIWDVVLLEVKVLIVVFRVVTPLVL